MNKKTIICSRYIFFLFCIAVCLAVKSFCYVGPEDGVLCIAYAKRFYMGDIPLIHEWHPTQLVGILLTPVYALYCFVRGNNEGVVVFFRIFQLTILFATTLFLFNVVKKLIKKEGIAFITVSMLLIYSTMNKELYTYYDISTLYLALTGVILLCAEYKHKNVVWLGIVGGITFTFAALSNPYNIIVYIYFAVLYFFRWKKENDKKNIKILIYFSCGCCVIGIPLIFYILANSSLNELVMSIHYVLDFPGRVPKSKFVSLLKWCWYAAKPYGIPLIILQGFLLIYALIKECTHTWKKIQKQTIFYLESIFLVLYLLIQYFWTDDKYVIGIAYIPLTILGFFCFIMSQVKEWRILYNLFIPGILMSMAFQCASDTNIYAMTTGFVLSAMASCVFLYRFCEENIHNTFKWTMYIVLGIAVGYTLFVRLDYTRHPLREEVIDCKIENGPYKGIYTDSNWKKHYEDAMSELAMIEDMTEETDAIFISETSSAWMYLCIERNVATPTCWRLKTDNPSLEPYYEMYPYKMPTYIYLEEVDKELVGKNIFLNNNRYQGVYDGVGKIYRRHN